MTTMTKTEQIARLHRLVKTNNDLYLERHIGKTAWQTNLRTIGKQMKVENITWDDIEAFEKENN